MQLSRFGEMSPMQTETVAKGWQDASPKPAQISSGRRWATRYPGLARGAPSGFTLVELLVAMAILVTVSAATALVFRGVTRAWRAGSLRTERYQQARLLFDLFGRELTAGVVNSRYPLLGTKPTGTARLREGSEFDELFFVGAFPGRAGFVERGYWVDAEQNLMCHDDEPADGDYATGASEVCGRDIATFTLSYFDGSIWLDEWDAQPSAAQAGRLPKAIHIILSIGSQHPEQFEMVIYLPAS